jgi:hypothetical protein
MSFNTRYQFTHPITIKRVVETRATFLPRQSQTSPTNICPIIAPVVEVRMISYISQRHLRSLPTSKLLETRVDTVAVYVLGYSCLKITYLGVLVGILLGNLLDGLTFDIVMRLF